MKIKKIVALLMTVCLLVSMSISSFAEEIQPRSGLSYGNFTLSAGGTRYLTNNGGNFTISAYKTVSISYSTGQSGSVKAYFHNNNTGTNTRVYASYTPTSMVSGYFYIYNSSSSSVYISNVSISY